MQEAEEAYLREQKIPGAILHLKPMNDQATRENIKELFDNFAPVRYIDFNKGEPEAYVRFHHANKAKEALDRATEKAGGSLELKGKKFGVILCAHSLLVIKKFYETKNNRRKN